MSSVLSDGGPETPIASAASQSGKSSAASDPMRAYRACLHCRGRKTKCNLEANGGRPVSLFDLKFMKNNLLSCFVPSGHCREVAVSVIVACDD